MGFLPCFFFLKNPCLFFAFPVSFLRMKYFILSVCLCYLFGCSPTLSPPSSSSVIMEYAALPSAMLGMFGGIEPALDMMAQEGWTL